jgi:hypothetical protein
VLPAIGVGLVAPRIRHYTITLNFSDDSGVTQVAIFETARHDQSILLAILRAREPQHSMSRPPAVGPLSTASPTSAPVVSPTPSTH